MFLEAKNLLYLYSHEIGFRILLHVLMPEGWVVYRSSNKKYLNNTCGIEFWLIMSKLNTEIERVIIRK